MQDNDSKTADSLLESSRLKSNQVNPVENNTMTNDVIVPVAPADNKSSRSSFSSTAAALVSMSKCQIIIQISSISIPVSLFYILLVILETLNLAFIGHTYENKEMLKGIGVVNIYLNTALVCFTYGISSGFDTLASFAYGRNQFRLLGVYMHRTFLVTLSTTVFLLVIHFFTAKYVLGFLANTDKSYEYAMRYFLHMLPFGLFDSVSLIVMRYLNVIKASMINALILLIIGLLHVPWLYIFITKLDLDVAGAALAFLLSRVVGCLCYIIALVFFNPVKAACFCFTKASFKLGKLIEYVKFALPAMFLSCAEMWSGQLQSIIALMIKFEDAYTVHLIIFTIYSLIYCIHFGLSISSATIVANQIVKSVKSTRKFICYSILYGYTLISLTILVIFIIRRDLISMFIEDKAHEILPKALKVFPFFCACLFSDMAIAILSSVFRGLGLQLRATIVTFVQFYVVMTSLSYFLGIYFEFGVVGMWIGMSIGYFSGAVIYAIMFLFTDLYKVKENSIEKVNRDVRDLNLGAESDELVEEVSEISD